MTFYEQLTRELCESDAGGGCGDLSRGVTAMKAKLCAAFVAAGCVLASSPADAISVTYNPMATMSSVPGAVLFDDFDSTRPSAPSPVAVRKIQATERRLRPEISS
jgi:hypothetical protein